MLRLSSLLYRLTDAAEKKFVGSAKHCSIFAHKQNKSNSTAGVVRVEANLPGTSAACAFFRANVYKKMFDLENVGQGHFSLALTVFEIFTFENW